MYVGIVYLCIIHIFVPIHYINVHFAQNNSLLFYYRTSRNIETNTLLKVIHVHGIIN